MTGTIKDRHYRAPEQNAANKTEQEVDFSMHWQKVGRVKHQTETKKQADKNPSSVLSHMAISQQSHQQHQHGQYRAYYRKTVAMRHDNGQQNPDHHDHNHHDQQAVSQR